MPMVASWMTFWLPRACKTALLAAWEVWVPAALLSAGAGTWFPDPPWARPPLTVLFEELEADCDPHAARRVARPSSARRRGRRLNDTTFTSQARTSIPAKSSDAAD